jgi:soluble P-type ATPase
VLIRSGEAIQTLKDIKVVVLDKTGTITARQARADRCGHALPGFEEARVLRAAASVEAGSEHPLGQAIVRARASAGWTCPRSRKFKAITARGVQGEVDGRPCGSAAAAAGRGRDRARRLDERLVALETEGKTAMLVAIGDRAAGLVAVADTIKEDSKAAIAAMHELGIHVVMVTGDNERTARHVAAQVGLDEVLAGVLPEGKVEAIRELQAEARQHVAMVGDGINDAPALKAGQCRHRHRRRRRCRHRGRRRDAGHGRADQGGRGDPPVEGHLPQDRPEPVLGLVLQPRRHPDRRARPAASDDRRHRHDRELALGDRQLAAAEAPWSRFLGLPELNVVLFALLLNYPWEFLQVPFFEEMAALDHWEAIVICSRAAAGDSLIALLALWVVSGSWRDRYWIRDPGRAQVAVFVAVGVLITIALEWHATEVADRWRYADHMPVVPLIGTGLLPLVQWILLPLLMVWLVRRQILGQERIQA